MMKAFSPWSDGFLKIGRYDKHEEAYNMWWSGSGVAFCIGCTQIEAEITSTASDHAQWLGVMMDGEIVARMPLRQGRHRYLLLAGMESGVMHEVSILRDTQPSYDEAGPLYLHAVYADGEPKAPESKPLLIEFLGDSLTVGEGTMGPTSAQEWRMMWISHMPAFPTLVASKLNAEKRVVALGGWGVWKSWDSNRSSRIGAIYEQLCGVTPGGDKPYPFDERKADAVVINLGTNDGSAFDKEPADQKDAAVRQLTKDVYDLIAMVRAHQPDAHIFWAYGLCGTVMEKYLKPAVEAYAAANGDKKVSYLPLPDADGDVGSRMHPSRAAHRRAAAVIADAIQKM